MNESFEIGLMNDRNIDSLLIGIGKIRDKEAQLVKKLVTQVKLLEENFLEIFDYLQDSDLEIDNKWLTMGKIDIETGVIKLIRSIKNA